MPRPVSVFRPVPTPNTYYYATYYDVPNRDSSDKKTVAVILIAVIAAMIVFICCCVHCCSRRRSPQGDNQTNTAVTAAVNSPSSGESSDQTASCSGQTTTGLNPKLLAALPVFIYCGNEENDKLECVVCLMEFKKGEKGRLLPRCGHMFHAECVDTWLKNHAVCPLCRSSVEPKAPPPPIIV